MQLAAVIFTAVFAILTTCLSIAAKVGFIVMIGAIIMAVADVIDASTAWMVFYVWVGCAVGTLLSLFLTGAGAVVVAD